MIKNNLKFGHRHVSNISCQIVEQTLIGFRVIETTAKQGKNIVKEKVFNNMDFDPEFGCWIPIKVENK